MDQLSLSLAALSAGTGIANYFTKKGDKQSVQLNLPNYTASAYDAPAASQLYSTLSDRVAGKNVGYSPEDLATMNDQAVDQSTRAGNDLINRSMAGRQNTGGVTTGGTNVLRDKAIMYSGGLRSNALRDIGIKNAVQKRQEINAAIPQEQTFLNSERTQAQQLYSNEMQKALLQKEEADKVAAFNQARQDSSSEGIMGLVSGLTSGFNGTSNSDFSIGQLLSGTTGKTGNTMSGYGSNSSLMPLGQLLAQFGKTKTGTGSVDTDNLEDFYKQYLGD